MLTRTASLLVFCLAIAGCSQKPAAAEVCSKLEAAGIAKNCREAKPLALTARAAQKYDFDLVEVPGKTGQVLTFAADDDYSATVEAFKAMAMLAGPHRYGNQKARVFLQMNDGASLDTGKKAQGVIEGL
ncbi:hypothetical protein ACSRUE_42035 [Sorangium sp. KYC3313]|uniref:hypothetical protein n=1 Tax=Sorangium sp. KYC3313 TaxID=3449740 RepID=UPI003F8A0AEA